MEKNDYLPDPNPAPPETVGNLRDDGIEIHKYFDAKPKRFGVVGERCSGTNLAEELMQRHTNLRPEGWGVYGWKHGYPNRVGYADDALLIVMFRDPFSWIRSLYRKPWHATLPVQQRDFGSFIRQPWETIVLPVEQLGQPTNSALAGHALQFDRHPIDGTVFENPLAMRKVKNQAFLGLKNRCVNTVYVRMESLAADPTLIMTCISIAFDLKLPRRVSLPKTRLGAYNRLAPAAKLPENLPQTDTDFILSQLDINQEKNLGYAY